MKETSHTCILAGALLSLFPLATNAATIWQENFDSLSTGSLTNDTDGTVDSFNTFYRIGGGTSVAIQTDTVGNHLYMGFRYHANNARVVLDSTWDDTQDYTLSFDLEYSSTQITASLPAITLAYGDGADVTPLGTLARVTFNTEGTNVIVSVSAQDIIDAGADGQNIYLTFTKPGSSGTGRSAQYYVDNLVLDATAAAVPEPSSAALLGLAGLGLILRRRK